MQTTLNGGKTLPLDGPMNGEHDEWFDLGRVRGVAVEWIVQVNQDTMDVRVIEFADGPQHPLPIIHEVTNITWDNVKTQYDVLRQYIDKAEEQVKAEFEL